MTERTWLSEASKAREAEILAALTTATSADTHRRIDELIALNKQTHERDCLNLNPASNVMSPRAEAALGHGLGTRASLGHAGAKYEMGLRAVEELEVTAAELACRVFDADYAEIRPPSGAMANLFTFMACAKPGDPIIVPPASIGGHVTHNTAGAAGLYGLEIHEAPIDPTTYSIDPEGVRRLAARISPKLITVGSSLNLHPHPVAELREIADECDATLMFDAAHACGLFAGKQWPNPLSQGAHVMTMSTYKSLAGPAGGLIVTNDASLAKRIDAIAYPGMTANFDAGRITALAISMLDWLDFGQDYCAEMAASAASLAKQLSDRGVQVFDPGNGATTSHQFAISDTNAAANVYRLEAAGLLTSEIGLPDGSGIRVGTPEAVRWGMTAKNMGELAGLIADALSGDPASVAPKVSAFRRPFDTIHFCSKSS